MIYIFERLFKLLINNNKSFRLYFILLLNYYKYFSCISLIIYLNLLN